MTHFTAVNRDSRDAYPKTLIDPEVLRVRDIADRVKSPMLGFSAIGGFHITG